MPTTHHAGSSAETKALRRPPLRLNASDLRRLEAIALNSLLRNPRVAGPLLEEIDRAKVASGPATVGLGSRVQFVDALSGRPQVVRVVEAPQTGADDEVGILSPLGVALIGLAAGQSILARDHLGSERLLTVLHVAPPPTAAG